MEQETQNKIEEVVDVKEDLNIENQSEDKPEVKKKAGDMLSVPMAIVVAGAMIAGAIYFSSVKKEPKVFNPELARLENVKPVGKEEYVRGNPKAPVKIIEYSDTECPFCKVMHQRMKKVMEEYGESGKVAWVYRHSPIDGLHPNARKEAEALECAGELGGNEKFWAYADRLYEITPSNNGLDVSELPNIAEYVGLERNSFVLCLDSGRHAEKIAKDLENAIATGGGATPWSILITKDGSKYPINGAQPYDVIKSTIEEGLK